METKTEPDEIYAAGPSNNMKSEKIHETSVTLLSGGGDKPYVFGLATELISKGAEVELIGSDDLDCPEFHGRPKFNFINLRGDQSPDVSFIKKTLRVLKYYLRLIRYAARAKPRIFHILWNNKFQYFDRTLLMLYYRALGKRIIITIHNVNDRKRDSNDTLLNRLTLRVQYHLAHHFFVHTEKMKRELIEEFGIQDFRIAIIPFGINNAVPNTSLTAQEARERLGIPANERVILFFGNIAPYKGLEYLVDAFHQIQAGRNDYRLIIAGRPKGPKNYWSGIEETISENVRSGSVLLRNGYIPDEEIEIFFKAADVLVLPYRYIYQSGVLFLGYSFGLPALSADVGSMKEDIVEGKTGFVFEPENPDDLARAIEKYFQSDMYVHSDGLKRQIQDYAKQHYSWDIVGHVTMRVYAGLSAVFDSRD